MIGVRLRPAAAIDFGETEVAMANGALVMCTLLAGCAGRTADAGDGINDSFLASGKTDTGGIQDGTPEAAGVLQLANEATLAVLDNDVGLSSKAADNIVAYREGDDGQPGTGDDQTFDTLAELDAVPYVGPAAFKALLAYAKANGYITTDPPPASTSGGTSSGTPATTLSAMGQAAATCYEDFNGWSQYCPAWKGCDDPVERSTDKNGTVSLSVQCSLTGAALSCTVSSTLCAAGNWWIADHPMSGVVSADGSFVLEDQGKSGTDPNYAAWDYRSTGKVDRSGAPTVTLDAVRYVYTSYYSANDGSGTTIKNTDTKGLTSDSIGIPLTP
jgi:hypothetical protein